MPNIIHGSGGVNIMTLPHQITSLACAGGTDGTAGTIDVSFTEVPASSWSLLQNYLLVFKAGSIPQTPFDGTRIVLPKGTAEAQKTYQITGLMFDQLYGVRIYPVSTRYQHQTVAEGATATVTPVNAIDSGALSIESKIAIPIKSAYQSKLGTEIIWKVADQNHTGYPANSTNLISDKILALLAFDAKEPTNQDSNRAKYGNNRYLYTNQLQWLNSNAAAGMWYSAKHSEDAAPTSLNVYYNHYDTWAGFLYMLDDDFVASLLDTTVTVAKNTVTDGGGSETVTAKMNLPSKTEVGLANENGIAEGTKLALFSDDTSRLSYPTAECVSNSEYSNVNLTTSMTWYYWLRTSVSSSTFNVRHVDTDGTLYYLAAQSGAAGVRPLCNLPNTFKLKFTPRADGCYIPF